MSNSEVDSQDDVWADSDNDDHVSYERNLAEREWEKLQEDHGNTGYKEGIVEGKEVNMQKGFDVGYIEGFAIGRAIGRLRGVVRQILKKEEAAKELDSLFDEIDKIEVNHVYNVDYFRGDQAKKPDGYIAPEAFVKQLEDKVNSTLNAVANKHQC